jgi:NAD(P)-dependent dehydrogenase (short-subunit alcohol dehydrogenase family)
MRAIVTGAARGLGAAIASAVAVMLDVSGEMQATAEPLADAGPSSVAVGQVAAMLDETALR